MASGPGPVIAVTTSPLPASYPSNTPPVSFGQAFVARMLISSSSIAGSQIISVGVVIAAIWVTSNRGDLPLRRDKPALGRPKRCDGHIPVDIGIAVLSPYAQRGDGRARRHEADKLYIDARAGEGEARTSCRLQRSAWVMKGCRHQAFRHCVLQAGPTGVLGAR